MHQSTKLPNHSSRRQRLYNTLRSFLPSPGNIVFMVLLIGLTLVGQDVFGRSDDLPQAEAATESIPKKIPYQGYLTDENSKPLDGLYQMTFRIYAQSSGGSAIWTEQRNGDNRVQIDDGLFSIQLGDVRQLSQDVIIASDALYLGITIGTGSEMIPRLSLQVTDPIPDESITPDKFDLSDGLDIGGDTSVEGDIRLDGTVQGPKSHWADYRPHIRFMKESGADAAAMCPEGGSPVGVVNPQQSLTVKTGDELAAMRYGGAGTCVNVHQMAPCGTINGDFYPYQAQSCTTDFSGKWSPFYWWNGTTHSGISIELLGRGIGCYPVKYACVE